MLVRAGGATRGLGRAAGGTSRGVTALSATASTVAPWPSPRPRPRPLPRPRPPPRPPGRRPPSSVKSTSSVSLTRAAPRAPPPSRSPRAPTARSSCPPRAAGGTPRRGLSMEAGCRCCFTPSPPPPPCSWCSTLAAHACGAALSPRAARAGQRRPDGKAPQRPLLCEQLADGCSAGHVYCVAWPDASSSSATSRPGRPVDLRPEVPAKLGMSTG